MMLRLCIIGMALLLALSACQMPRTEYGSTPAQGEGYMDRKIGENKYEIQATGNQSTQYHTLENFFHRRAKELCVDKTYDYDTKREKRTKIVDGMFTGTAYIPSETLELPMITGEITCKK